MQCPADSPNYASKIVAWLCKLGSSFANRLGASMVGSMATLNLPEHAWPTPESPYRKRLDEHRIQVPAFRCSFRASVHVFNSRDDRGRLAAALRAIKDSTR